MNRLERLPPVYEAKQKPAILLQSDSHEDVTCDCPPRSKVPDRPNKLPFKATNANVSKMRDWLLKRYAASTFNVCQHKLLQQISGPPLEIHLESDAKPRA